MAAKTTRLHFTDAKVRALLRDAEGTTGRAEYQDDENPYLRARISDGLCAWSAFGWHPVQRKAVRFKIGTHITHNVKAARDAAATAFADMRAGVDVAKERKTKRAEASRSRQTVADMLEDYITRCADEGKPLRPHSIKAYRFNLPELLGDYFTKPIDALDSDTLKALIVQRSKPRMRPDPRTGVPRKVGSPDGARMGCDALTRLCRVYGVPDPVQELRINWRGFPKHGVRDGRLGETEARELFAWLHDFQAGGANSPWLATQARMFMLALITGWRSLTISKLRWEHIKWTKGTIELPADIMKNKKPLTVPLYGTVADLLRPHKQATGFVFENAKGSFSEFKDDFLSQLPFQCSPHDARKIISLVLGSAEGVMHAVPRMLIGHSPGRGDVHFTHYINTTPLPDRLRHMRKGTDAVDAFYRAKIGDKKLIRALDRHANARRLIAAQRLRDNKAAYEARRAAKRAAIRALAA